jgi:hypothetical protein
VADNPYRISLDALQASTGHAHGQSLVESEPEVEVPHDLPLRVTPMSPVSEIAAYGQLTQARPSRRGLARGTALAFLALVAGSLLWSALHPHSSPDRPAPPAVPVQQPLR